MVARDRLKLGALLLSAAGAEGAGFLLSPQHMPAGAILLGSGWTHLLLGIWLMIAAVLDLHRTHLRARRLWRDDWWVGQ